MATPKYSFLALCVALTSLYTNAGNQPTLKIRNSLENCIEVSQTEISDYKGILIAALAVKKRLPIAECGCKSMLGEFKTFTTNSKNPTPLLGGKIIPDKEKILYLPVAAQAQIAGDKPITLVLSCARPD